MNKTILLVFQIISAILLVVLILLQAKGVGLGRSFLGNSQSYSTKRGFEKIIFNLTIAIGILFFFSSLVQLII